MGCASEFVDEPIEEVKKRKYIFVAGGLGTAPVYPQVSISFQQVLEDVGLSGRDVKDEMDKSVERINAKLKRYTR